ncbi:ATP-binding protein [Anaeropeptidivorans aminofermentans]|uniref:ATP-binding protein n=1 Tax=Anaeropeptidivorans aminofermentans TaxID=2934315 RepID=UPI0038CC03EC
MALLVSDQCKRSIKFAIFQGTDKLVFKDGRELTGSLFTQVNAAYKTIYFYNRTKATFQDLLRTDERTIQKMTFVRHCLMLSFTETGRSTFINLYSDRLEFISLGGLILGLSLETAMLGASQPRNEKLANIFYHVKLIEA